MKMKCDLVARRITLCLCAGLILAGALLASGAARAAWPEHNITIIVPFPPGGPNDLLGRLLAAELAPKLGQNVIVENRAGAVGNIGLAASARAAPDGLLPQGVGRRIPQLL
jgi:tripartite-type tricarboxylate transporter receptor subunit TctC